MSQVVAPMRPAGTRLTVVALASGPILISGVLIACAYGYALVTGAARAVFGVASRDHLHE
jgi:hypothetical protein